MPPEWPDEWGQEGSMVLDQSDGAVYELHLRAMILLEYNVSTSESCRSATWRSLSSGRVGVPSVKIAITGLRTIIMVVVS